LGCVRDGGREQVEKFPRHLGQTREASISGCTNWCGSSPHMEFDHLLQTPTMANQQPYIQQNNFPYTHIFPTYRNAPTSNQQNVPSTSTAPPANFSSPSTTLPQSSFRAPAHKHAHHLHSIPPREKSTRTLIIDHMLWVHGERFLNHPKINVLDRFQGERDSPRLERS
jgi:hypothetical protein